MAIHTFHQRQRVHANGAQLWDFFSQPRNLLRLTPPDVGFEMLTPDLAERVYPGMMIAHRLQPLPGLRVTWLTEITHVEAGRRFVDEQRRGPFALWHHEHAFRDLEDGWGEVEDRVTYVLPFGPLGDLVHPLVVRPQLQRLFAHREAALRAIFPG